MNREENLTKNNSIENIDQENLKKYFSHCFDKSGDFDFNKFKKEISKTEIDFSKESYGMDWLGKSYARLLASDPATTLLKEDKVWNSKEENKNSENVLIKGDNLEVLKHLSHAYHEQVKMIYIDPPYNTGSDGFVYEDDRKFDVKEFSKLAGVDEEKAKRILDFVDSKSNSHSAWLTFMYPRLYIAHQLLKDDGVILISIDDNEVAQLKILMDEIFGEENFLSTIVWEKRFTRSNSTKKFATLTENLICYRKSNSLSEVRETRNDKANSTYSNPDNDERGVWTSVSYVGPTSIDQRPNLHYELTNPITNKKVIHSTRPWKYEKNTYLSHVKENRLYWGKDGNNSYPRLKRFLSEVGDTMVPVNFWTRYEAGTTDEASKNLEKLFSNKKVFEFPKPTLLVQKSLKIAANKDSIVLDFFGGSGTTGDAVMQLNSEDGGNRKYIMVQLPEEIDKKKNKVAYDFVKDQLGVEEPTIFDITKERLIRAAKKIQDENVDKKAHSEDKECDGIHDEHCNACKGKYKIKIPEQKAKDLSNIDLGFKVFETKPIWEDYNFEAEKMDNQVKLFDESKLGSDEIEMLLTTWKTKDNIVLTQDLEKVDLGGYIGHYFDGKLYLMDKNFKTNNLKVLLDKLDSDEIFEPHSIIAFGYHFESKALREIADNVSSYANKKSLDIDFITRY